MFIKPMLARPASIEDVDKYSEFYSEPKHDGMRAIVVVKDRAVEIYSRTGKPQKGKLPLLEAELSQMPDGTYDGELGHITKRVMIAGQRVPIIDFNATMRVMGSGVDKAASREPSTRISFLLFEVIDGLIDKSEFMESASAPGHVVLTPVWEPSINKVSLYDQIIAAGGEGLIVKRPDTTYEAGSRSKGWFKLKAAQTFDVVVMGFTDGGGKYSGKVGAIEFGAYMPNGELRYVGRCSGMDDGLRQWWTNIRAGYEHQDNIVIEVKANDMVGSGEYRTPRHPQYMHIRIDRTPESCLMEQFKAVS